MPIAGVHYYQDLIVPDNATQTLKHQWWLDGAVIDTYIALLNDLVDRRLHSILPTTRPKVIMFLTQSEALQYRLATHLLDVSIKCQWLKGSED